MWNEKCLVHWESNSRQALPAKDPSHEPGAEQVEVSWALWCSSTQPSSAASPSLLFSSYFSSYFYHLPGALLPGELIFSSSMLIAIKVPPCASLPGPSRSPCRALRCLWALWNPSTNPLVCSQLSCKPFLQILPLLPFGSVFPVVSLRCEMLHFPPSPTARLQGPPPALPSGALCIPSNEKLD